MSARSGVSVVAAEATEPASAGVLTFSGGALEEAGEGAAAGGGAATAAALHTSRRKESRELRRDMERHRRTLRRLCDNAVRSAFTCFASPIVSTLALRTPSHQPSLNVRPQEPACRRPLSRFQPIPGIHRL